MTGFTPYISSYQSNQVNSICIVTTRHISYNPRVLKEADALHKAGYKVTVVTINNKFSQSRFDEEIMQSRQWALKTVNYRKEIGKEKIRWVYLSLKQKLFSYLSRWFRGNGIAERAMNKAYDPLLRLAKEVKAGLYIAHHPEALGIGYKAARKNKAKFAFDAEDFHTGMNEGSEGCSEEKLIQYLEEKYLPLCNYLTAASKGIAEAYASKYAISLPTVVLNVFPKVNLSSETEPNKIVKFYWYSQVIGPNRNLEYLIQAASAIEEPFEIHLRGSFHSHEYESNLKSLIRQFNLNTKIFFHRPILAEQIIPDASQYDVGLALETKVSVNRDICVTNKIFAYLMAGLAIIGTDTSGQKDIFGNFSEATYLCGMDNVTSLIKAMRYYIQNPAQLLEVKRAAREAAMDQFNWETESQKILNCIMSAMSEQPFSTQKPRLVPLS